MVGSCTALADPAEEELSCPRFLSSSLSSIPSPHKARSEFFRVYKHSSELFLTRRLLEAFSAIKPLITVPQPSEDTTKDEYMPRRAPIASASRRDRTKVWVLYLTVLNAIADLGPEDGMVAFGKKAWRDLVTKAIDGTIWEEVVDVGYGGAEGNVDADVVISLATLLLARSPTQTANQQHLESYLSAANSPSLNFERLDCSQPSNGHSKGQAHNSNGTDTPRDLNARVDIIELYALHVLPRNGEWGYAREFISMSDVLDEDVKDAFLQDLLALENEESRGDEDLENPSRPQEELIQQEPQPVDDTERDSIDTIRQVPPRSHHRSNSETDYGIENTESLPIVQKSTTIHPQPTSKAIKPQQAKASPPPPIRGPRKGTDSGILKPSIALAAFLQQAISRMKVQMSRNPMGLLRFVLFLIGFIVAVSRRDVKDRLGRLTGTGWDKLRRTVGMGVKVSYI